MKLIKPIYTALLVAFLLLPAARSHSSQPAPEDEIGTCDECTAPQESGSFTGMLEAVSRKARMLQVRNGATTKIIRFDDNTIVLGAPKVGAIPLDTEIAVDYLETGGGLLAISVDIATSTNHLKKNQIDAATLAILLKDSAPITLVDARLAASFASQHIPGAISIYNGRFDENINLLPRDKDQLIVYYCDGTA